MTYFPKCPCISGLYHLRNKQEKKKERKKMNNTNRNKGRFVKYMYLSVRPQSVTACLEVYSAQYVNITLCTGSVSCNVIGSLNAQGGGEMNGPSTSSSTTYMVGDFNGRRRQLF